MNHWNKEVLHVMIGSSISDRDENLLDQMNAARAGTPEILEECD
jgi:hypothetical protein